MVPETLDEQQINALKKGDRRAQHKLFNSCYSYVCSVAYRYTKNVADVEQLGNESLFKVLTKIEQYSEGLSFRAWVRQITVRTVIDWLRKEKRINANETDWDFSEMPGGPWEPIVEQMKNLQNEDIQKILEFLPQNTRVVFNLYVFDGYTHKEIAEITGLSDGTSKWHLSHARKLLKETVDKIYRSANSIAL